MAGFYWYERNPQLFNDEKQAMNLYFPNFVLDRLADGRICWVGNLNPRGADGGTWTLMVVYDHNHPHNNTYGGSLRVYSVKPDLNELYKAAGSLPHVLRDANGDLYMCTARKEDIDSGNRTTSAAKALGWAAKWIFAVEGWLAGEIGDEVFEHAEESSLLKWETMLTASPPNASSVLSMATARARMPWRVRAAISAFMTWANRCLWAIA